MAGRFVFGTISRNSVLHWRCVTWKLTRSFYWSVWRWRRRLCERRRRRCDRRIENCAFDWFDWLRQVRDGWCVLCFRYSRCFEIVLGRCVKSDLFTFSFTFYPIAFDESRTVAGLCSYLKQIGTSELNEVRKSTVIETLSGWCFGGVVLLFGKGDSVNWSWRLIFFRFWLLLVVWNILLILYH